MALPKILPEPEPPLKTNRSEFRMLPVSPSFSAELVGLARLWNYTPGSDMPWPEHELILRKVGKVLRKNRDVFCRIIAMASRSGRDDFNQKLSENRARNVHGWMTVKEGVNFEQLAHRSGSRFLALGEKAWEILGVPDTTEKGRHRLVVLMLWRDNNPDIVTEMRILRSIMRRDALVL